MGLLVVVVVLFFMLLASPASKGEFTHGVSNDFVVQPVTVINSEFG